MKKVTFILPLFLSLCSYGQTAKTATKEQPKAIPAKTATPAKAPATTVKSQTQSQQQNQSQADQRANNKIVPTSKDHNSGSGGG